MKGTRSLWLSLTLVLLSGLAYADGLPPGDPAIEINDPICDTPSQCPTIDAGVPFTFSADQFGNGDILFRINPNGPALTDLDLQTVGIFPTTSFVACTGVGFVCDVTFIGNVTNMFFHAPPSTCGSDCPPPSYPAGALLEIKLGANANGGSWGPNQPFGGIYDLGSPATEAFISTPEPSSLLLVGTGAIFALTRKLKFRKN